MDKPSDELTTMFKEYNTLIETLSEVKINAILNFMERTVKLDMLIEDLEEKRIDNIERRLELQEQYGEECDDDECEYCKNRTGGVFCEECGEPLNNEQLHNGCDCSKIYKER